MALAEWWIEPSIGLDAGGNLYSVWDTQGTSTTGTPIDTGWLSYSSDGGTTWSTPIQGPADQQNVPHIMQVTGGAAGVAYVGWLSPSDPKGYALYLRPFSTAAGWLSTQQQMSTQFGNPSVWAGDTFGLSTLGTNNVAVSWGSAVPSSSKQSNIYATTVTTHP